MLPTCSLGIIACDIENATPPMKMTLRRNEKIFN